ncbi:DedA family protein [Kineosporia babensis]|uniref:DedA family protein n=1 Tax=Kineosporia babensis TaxID=499548 RepID=A0A9X1SW42_9ACTN|nr:DedA family protein [Kineosporia babensis]MCD5314334.1 DedA family protein [Kineosporia babensis]
MTSLTDIVLALSAVPAPVAVAAAGAFAIAESGLGIGMFVPGETMVLLLGAVLADSPFLILLFIVVALGSSAGDHIGYLLGRHYGERLRQTRLVARIGAEQFDRAGAALNRWGAWAVFLTRLVPVVRTLTPALAGVSGVGYSRFLVASLAGATLWSGVYTLAGALAGTSLTHLESLFGRTGSVLGLGLVAIAAGALLWRRRTTPS